MNIEKLKQIANDLGEPRKSIILEAVGYIAFLQGKVFMLSSEKVDTLRNGLPVLHDLRTPISGKYNLLSTDDSPTNNIGEVTLYNYLHENYQEVVMPDGKVYRRRTDFLDEWVLVPGLLQEMKKDGLINE